MNEELKNLDYGKIREVMMLFDDKYFEYEGSSYVVKYSIGTDRNSPHAEVRTPCLEVYKKNKDGTFDSRKLSILLTDINTDNIDELVEYISECIGYTITNYDDKLYMRYRLKELKGTDKIIDLKLALKFNS